jgi:IS5 family transposase
VVDANALLHGDKSEALGEAGCHGVDRRADAEVRCNVAMRPGERCALDKRTTVDQLTDQLECLKATIHAKVEHPFRVIKRPYGHVTVRHRVLEKNTAQPGTLFAPSSQ